jgi:16S rRNA (uracil1498-N3)-methyltransferase
VIPRLYCPRSLSVGDDVDLPAAVAHHAARVLRLKIGSALTLFNGEGGEYAARIDVAGPRAVVVHIDAVDRIDRESPLDVTVVHGLAGTDRMDYAVQKAVELGARAVIPVSTTRSVVQLDDRRAAKRTEHWQAIAVAACEQCGRNIVPVIAPLRPLHEWLAATSPAALRLVLAPNGDVSLGSIAEPTGAIELLVGAEGGLTDEESAAALKVGFTPVRVGPRILRTETAAVAALAAMNVLWGDWR